ncbi:hypothetical protein SAMN05518672_11624 [Chitinophaga sp. CF118]|uniref:DUF6169 family protein n=1 Tax=Chitinophaga sp. CF118 TaxID=1884367 RepID=UPI0008EB4CD0|nr:DUF6169 family protein [Chitinophaga sp. CF118]SFF09655.1 hypothetical protein SAMN05518672_11624 [Chitinophaga sp. CF118]
MYTPYEVTLTKEGYEFTTDTEIVYKLYFSSYYLTDEAGEDVKVLSFGFYNVPETVHIKDPRIKETIVGFIKDFFDKNPDIGMLYLCDQKGDLARQRRIIFGSWHREVKNEIEKHDCKEHHARQGYYSSLLIRSDNPLKQYYIDAFYRNLDEYLGEG